MPQTLTLTVKKAGLTESGNWGILTQVSYTCNTVEGSPRGIHFQTKPVRVVSRQNHLGHVA